MRARANFLKWWRAEWLNIKYIFGIRGRRDIKDIAGRNRIQLENKEHFSSLVYFFSNYRISFCRRLWIKDVLFVFDEYLILFYFYHCHAFIFWCQSVVTDRDLNWGNEYNEKVKELQFFENYIYRVFSESYDISRNLV